MISVVLVTYNSLDVLPACMASLIECTSALQLEIVIVDNLSTDGTRDWLGVWKQRYYNLFLSITIVELTDNRGYAFANNRGLEVCKGETILLLNPDTLVGRTAIEICAERLLSNENIGAVGCRLELGDGTLDRACKRSFPTLWNSFSRLTGLSIAFSESRFMAGYNLSYLDEHSCFAVDCLCGAFLMFSRTVLDDVGFLDEDFFMYGEDIDWCYRIRRFGYQIWYQGTVTTIHYKGGNGGKGSRQSLKHFYETMHLYYVKTLGHRPQSLSAIMIRCILTVMFEFHCLTKGIKA